MVRKKILHNSSSTLGENTRPFLTDLRQFDDRPSRDDEDLKDIYRTTLRDLDFERDRRWRAEQEIKHLNDRLEEFQKRSEDSLQSSFISLLFSPLDQDGRSNENVLQELAEKHQQRLADEKSKFQDLTNIVDDYKVNDEARHLLQPFFSLRNVFGVRKSNCLLTRKLRKPIYS